MPLLDIAVAQSSFQNYLGYPRVQLQLLFNGKVGNYSLLQYEERWASFQKSFHNSRNMNLFLGHCNKPLPKFLVKAVATLQPKYSVSCEDGGKKSTVLSSAVKLASSTDPIESNDSEDLDERERLRRLRISKANKGNTPWNKGRKHSPETLQRIKERTRLAMQDPKVRMKMVNLGHQQSDETREKIALGVRRGWQKRREKKMLQENCLFDWQNIIAEAARKGLQDEEELQWDSYKILTEQLLKEWLESVEARKAKPKGSKRAPKSLEQRRKIAAAIAAKWADPEYRSKVCSGLAKRHGTEGVERKPRRKPSGEVRTRSPRTSKEKTRKDENSAANEMKPKKKRSNAPKYKDPLASYKLEMLKSIRAQRGGSDTKKNEALERAKLLIAEAEKAATALEVAATRSLVAQASLIEARKLIAEAIQWIESIENGELPPEDILPSGHQNHVEKPNEAVTEEDESEKYQKGVNGISALHSGEGHSLAFNLRNLTLQDETNIDFRVPANINGYKLGDFGLHSFIGKSDSNKLMGQCHAEHNGSIKLNGVSSTNGAKLQIQKEHTPTAGEPATKKWVRGRLVEVVEGK